MSWDFLRRSLLPRGSFRLRTTVGVGRWDDQWGVRLVHFYWDPRIHRHRLALHHLHEERRNLDSRPALSAKVWRGLVSSSLHVTRRCSTLRLARRRMVVTEYPFLRFWSTVVIPTSYWIGVIELGVLAENDDPFSLTFGQVSPVSILVILSLGS